LYGELGDMEEEEEADRNADGFLGGPLDGVDGSGEDAGMVVRAEVAPLYDCGGWESFEVERRGGRWSRGGGKGSKGSGSSTIRGCVEDRPIIVLG
jgi:hypothetical protein